ncbi:MAG: hypothetical protein RL219_1270 [Actinomycetota bacterium]
MQRFSESDLWNLWVVGAAEEQLSGSMVIVEPDGSGLIADEIIRSTPALFVSHTPWAPADVVVAPSEIPRLLDVFERTPLAAMALVILLRGSEQRSVHDGLIAESITYSMLQGGPEFAAWRAAYRPRERMSEIGPAVTLEETPRQFVITLSRPHVHNALNRRMRDALTDALWATLLDPTHRPVMVRGVGPSFCSGGDLDEFGSFPSNAAAHLIRLTRSPARAVYTLGSRMAMVIHGNCMGAGIELPAFTGSVTAGIDTVIALPEVAMGLVPGAGGTISLPRRIGRQRTAWLALTGERIDAETALDWGLVDRIVDDVDRVGR